jgi:hypothetical protein
MHGSLPQSMSTSPPTFAASPARGALLCLLILLVLKLLAYALDPTARVFLGDSGSYFHTALTGWIPPDRSFLYGWLIGATAIPSGSVQTLVLLQSGFGVLSGLLLYLWLAFGLRSDVRLAIVAAAIFALDPGQLFYERMMMAEASGFLAFASFFCALSLYVARGGWIWIAAYAALGVLAVALRISLMPVVLVLCLIGPGVRWISLPPAQRFSGWHIASAVLSSVIAVGCTVYAHDWYKHWYGEVSGTAPAYTAQAGKFRLGLVAPLIEPEHFENSGVSAELLGELKIELRDPRMRESQMWTEGGLYDLLSRHAVDPETAARKISIKAARDNPLGLVRMGLQTLADYFDPAVYLHRIEDDLGRREPHREFRDDLIRHLDFDPGLHYASWTPASRWFAWGSLWLTACLLILLPLAAFALYRGWHSPQRGLRLLLALTSVGLVLGHVLFSHIVSFRYLHPLPWFVLANLAVLLHLRWQRRLSAGRDTPRTSS